MIKNGFRWMLGCCLVVLMGCSSVEVEPDVPLQVAPGQYAVWNTLAWDALQRLDFDQAASTYDQMEAYFPTARHSQAVMVGNLYARFRLHDHLGVQSLAEHYLQLYPLGKYADYVCYLDAVATLGQPGNVMEHLFHANPARRDVTPFLKAYAKFDQVIRMYPHSPYAVNAWYYLMSIRQILAAHELTIALFYEQRGIVPAARGRAQALVERYPGTPASQRAQRLLARLPS